MKVGAEKDSTGKLKDQSEIMNGDRGFRGEDDYKDVKCKQGFGALSFVPPL